MYLFFHFFLSSFPLTRLLMQYFKNERVDSLSRPRTPFYNILGPTRLAAFEDNDTKCFCLSDKRTHIQATEEEG